MSKERSLSAVSDCQSRISTGVMFITHFIQFMFFVLVLSTNSTIHANFEEERHSEIKLIPTLQVLWDKSYLPTVKLISTKSVGCGNGG